MSADPRPRSPPRAGAAAPDGRRPGPARARAAAAQRRAAAAHRGHPDGAAGRLREGRRRGPRPRPPGRLPRCPGCSRSRSVDGVHRAGHRDRVRAQVRRAQAARHDAAAAGRPARRQDRGGARGRGAAGGRAGRRRRRCSAGGRPGRPWRPRCCWSLLGHGGVLRARAADGRHPAGRGHARRGQPRLRAAARWAAGSWCRSAGSARPPSTCCSGCRPRRWRTACGPASPAPSSRVGCGWSSCCGRWPPSPPLRAGSAGSSAAPAPVPLGQPRRAEPRRAATWARRTRAMPRTPRTRIMLRPPKYSVDEPRR